MHGSHVGNRKTLRHFSSFFLLNEKLLLFFASLPFNLCIFSLGCNASLPSSGRSYKEDV